jgi:RNA polymerase sigma factor (sigma-70 family)
LRDQQAFAQLREVSDQWLFEVALGILGDMTDAEDTIMVVYFEVWQSAYKFDPERGTVRAWLYAICRGKSIDLQRRNERWRRQHETFRYGTSDTPTSDPSPQELLEMIQEQLRARSALKLLPPIVRDIVEMTFFDELSHQQVAERTHMALGTVKSHVRRSLSKLRVELSSVTHAMQP